MSIDQTIRDHRVLADVTYSGYERTRALSIIDRDASAYRAGCWAVPAMVASAVVWGAGLREIPWISSGLAAAFAIGTYPVGNDIRDHYRMTRERMRAELAEHDARERSREYLAQRDDWRGWTPGHDDHEW